MKNFFTKQFSSLTYLNITQFLGALNDNIYKFLIVYFLIDILGIENGSLIMGTTGAAFVLPFLIFSASAGTLADRCSKRNIIVLTKVFELLIMAFGVLSFAFHSVFGAYSTLFLMATQSAIFGPSKYGIIPEIVSNEKISQANGLMTSFTFLAIIVGTFLASFITELTNRDFILCSLLCTGVSLIGIITSFGIEYTPPAGSSKRFDILFLREVFQCMKLAAKEPSLLPCILGSTYFLFLGAYIQLNMIPFAISSLGLTDVQGGYLFLLTALGIGLGSVIAGKISGKTVEMGLTPFSVIGISIGLFLLDYFSSSLVAVIPLITILGILGGIYQVPLDAYIQIASPKHYRGQIVATANFLSFFGVLLASGFLYVTNSVLQLPPSKGFTVMGFISAIVACAWIFQFFDYATRFVGMILSKIHFRTTYLGSENIPLSTCIYVCQHTAWNDTLLLLGAQKRRIRFFIEQEQEHKEWVKKLYQALRVILIPNIEPLDESKECLSQIHETLKKGISVCIFIEDKNIDKFISQLKESAHFQKIFTKDYPIIPVYIDKGTKLRKTKFSAGLFAKFRVPATISFGSKNFSYHMLPGRGSHSPFAKNSCNA